MKSKAEVIRTHLAEKTVFDIGGIGYGQPNAYEQELADAWSLCKRRVSVDYSDTADISVDLNTIPLPKIHDRYDIATAFDVLEHLEHPVDVLRWIPSDQLIVTLPNALSWIARRMEEKNQSKHLFSFTPYTASILLGEGGWGCFLYLQFHDMRSYIAGHWLLLLALMLWGLARIWTFFDSAFQLCFSGWFVYINVYAMILRRKKQANKASEAIRR